MILAIDPGETESAYLFMSDRGSVFDHGKIPNRDLLILIKTREYHRLVIEEVRSYGMAVGQSVFTTIEWIGRFHQCAFDRSLPVSKVGRKEVAIYWCCSPKAKDSNIRARMLDVYGKPGTKRDQGNTYGITKDVWSALAIAGYWQQTHPIKLAEAAYAT